ncbi:MAG: Fpg/Nei family DNA glycosylase [Egibacteraceae bacterium]
MTQLPEVEVIRKDLEREVVGKRFKEVHVNTASMVGRHRNRPDFCKALEGQKIESVGRRGTLLVFEFDNANALVVRLGPEALLTRETATEEPGENNQVVATFTTGGALHLVDAAKSSELYVIEQSEIHELKELNATGIDPLADTFTWQAFAGELKTRQTRLKKLFVDESFIIGLGDLYSDEILWTAGLAGTRVSNTLSSQEVRRLYRAIFEVLYEAGKQGGTSAGARGEHTDLFGEPGEYGSFLNVFDMEGRACSRCRRQIHRTRLERDLYSFHCEGCQT